MVLLLEPATNVKAQFYARCANRIAKTKYNELSCYFVHRNVYVNNKIHMETKTDKEENNKQCTTALENTHKHMVQCVWEQMPF